MTPEEVKNIVDVNLSGKKSITIQDVHQIVKVVYDKAMNDVLNVIDRLDGQEPGFTLANKPKEVTGRRVGNTTRLADWYIQYLFKNAIKFSKDGRMKACHLMIYDYRQSNKGSHGPLKVGLVVFRVWPVTRFWRMESLIYYGLKGTFLNQKIINMATSIKDASILSV